MELIVNLDIRKLPDLITYSDRILLVGSCFTEHIGQTLHDMKFDILQNPNGILFDPASVCKSLISYVDNRQYNKSDLFMLNEVWHSWDHHSRFSNIDPNLAVATINGSQAKAHDFLKTAKWIVITLGSSYSYRLQEPAPLINNRLPNRRGVANCHRAPGQWFEKHMLAIDETIALLDECYHRLMNFNPGLNIIFTISPVRHLRDGVIDNNRSKARLIEAVHHLANKFDRIHYFPAYELIIDVLRDYRFYDIDMAHPNYLATEFVMEKFTQACIDVQAQDLMREIRTIHIARRHRAFQPATQAHHTFLQANLAKAKILKEKYPFLDLQEELDYFNTSSDKR